MDYVNILGLRVVLDGPTYRQAASALRNLDEHGVNLQKRFKSGCRATLKNGVVELAACKIEDPANLLAPLPYGCDWMTGGANKVTHDTRRKRRQ